MHAVTEPYQWDTKILNIQNSPKFCSTKFSIQYLCTCSIKDATIPLFCNYNSLFLLLRHRIIMIIYHYLSLQYLRSGVAT